MADPLWLLAIGMAIVVGGILALRLHPFLALIAGGLAVGALTPRSALESYALDQNMAPAAVEQFVAQSPGERLARGFGDTCGQIGILIAMASIIGVCLLESGAAERIVRSSLRLCGERLAPLAFLISSFVLAIPIFFDTVFYMMIPLAKAMAVRTGKNFVFYVLAIIAGGVMAHSLVPPTPGPLLVAGALHVDLGVMILGGLVVGAFTSGSGFVYAWWANRRWPTPVRSTPDISAEQLEALARQDERELPPLGLSLLPILLPLVLIAGSTLQEALDLSSPFWNVLVALGDKNLALTLSAAVAMIILLPRLRRSGGSMTPLIQNALVGAGVIILITAGGGAFGQILKQTDIADRIRNLSEHYRLGILPLAFGVTALVRTAQGSATVAMITAIGIVGGLAERGGLPFHPVYLALAIGCGSKPFPWMNDSAFWVISRMAGWSEMETLRMSSVLIAGMGLVGLPVVMTLAWLFPLV